jgi:flagellar protein FliO/FliZ
LPFPAAGGGSSGREISVLDQLFGGELSVPLRFIIAFGVVLSLIALTFVGLRRFAGRRLPLANAGRARQPRLGVLDAFAIDARRRLVLIRRDNVEHLIMIGGPNDVLIESEIVRAPAQANLPPQQQRTQQRPAENVRAAVNGAPNGAPAPQRERAPAAEAPVAMAPEPAEPEVRPPPFRSTLPRSAPPLQANVPPPLPPRAPVRPLREPTPVPQRAAAEETERPAPPAAPARPKADVDPLYADIEKKLSEALARPTSPAPQARPAPPAPARREPAVEAPARRELATEAPRPAPAPPPQEPKSHLDALEEEMASLLGRERPS